MGLTNILSFIMIFAVFAFFIMAIVGGIKQWHNNNNSPRLKVIATVVAKRIDETIHQQPIAGDITGAHGYQIVRREDYYVIFQVESGDTLQFSVKSSEYRELTEGDYGNLFFQGTRYLGFEKI